MGRCTFGLAVLASLVAAGCASTPDEPAANAAASETPAVAAASGSPTMAAATDGTTANAVDVSGETEAVDEEDLAATERVTCREMLKQGSNVIVTQCMTDAAWKSYERFRERDAQEVLRMLQGSSYRR